VCVCVCVCVCVHGRCAMWVCEWLRQGAWARTPRMLNLQGHANGAKQLGLFSVGGLAECQG